MNAEKLHLLLGCIFVALVFSTIKVLSGVQDAIEAAFCYGFSLALAVGLGLSVIISEIREERHH